MTGVAPGTVVTISGIPEGWDWAPAWECQGYTLRVDGLLWRGVLRSFSRRPDGDAVELVISDRVPLTCRPSPTGLPGRVIR